MNALTDYTLEDAVSLFNITSDGELVLAGSLDREVNISHSFSVLAVDSTAPDFSASAAVLVLVQDVNEFPPVFQQPFIMTSLMENVPVGTQVTSLLATDADNSPTSNITYSVTTEQSHLFSIDSLSGILTTQVVFDYELNSTTYNITVLAIDSVSDPLTSTATVQLIIEDVNEFAPQFSESNVTTSVAENVSAGVLVIAVQATDDDRGSAGIVAYRLASSLTNLPFILNESSGEIRVNGTLDRESKASYDVTVEAYNPVNGGVAMSDTVLIRIVVADVNDNAPVFTQDAYSAVIPSNLPAGSSVVQLVAMDADEGANAAMQYSLVNPTELFQLSLDSGLLSTSSPLTTGVFNLLVVATDKGQPPMSSSSAITITIVTPFSVDFSSPKGPGFLLPGSTPTSQQYGLFITEPPGSSGTVSGQLGNTSTTVNYQTSYPIAHSVEGRTDSLVGI